VPLPVLIDWLSGMAVLVVASRHERLRAFVQRRAEAHPRALVTPEPEIKNVGGLLQRQVVRHVAPVVDVAHHL
jgi:hypothetical protein